MPFPSNDEIKAMVAELSETTRKELDQATDAADREARSHQLVWAAIGSVAYRQPSEDELLKFYAGLPAENRAKLENLDPDELLPALRKLHREKFGRRGGPPRGGEFRGPRPPGSPGPPGPDFDRQPPGFASPKTK
jgi:hypothetical protein